MSKVVLDSGILIASVFPETYTLQAKQLLKQLQTDRIMLHAPALLRYEVVAVCRKAVYRKRVTAEEGLKARNILLSYPITTHFDDNLLKRGYELATENNRPTAYDAQYLALAEQLSCDFWTTDERLFNSIKDTSFGIRWLGNMTDKTDTDGTEE